MKYLLDTNVISQFAWGQAGVVARIQASSPVDLAISSITTMEISYGFRLNPARTRKVRPVIELLLTHIAILPFDAADAAVAGEIRADLRIQGQPVGPFDLLIAGCALHRGLCLAQDCRTPTDELLP